MKTQGRLSFSSTRDPRTSQTHHTITELTEFITAYESRLKAILTRHGLSNWSRCQPQENLEICSWLIEADSPSALFNSWERTQEDKSWQNAINDCSNAYELSHSNGQLSHYFSLYQTTAGSGITTVAGPGIGHWQTYEPTDGLADGIVDIITQDKEGFLWFGTLHGGLSRFDGQIFTTFSTQDGLASNEVLSIFTHSNGSVWVATLNGISQWDGTNFITFSAADGLAGNLITSILEDQDQQLWISTQDGGICCYDGTNFTSFSTDNGLASNHITTMLQDQHGNLWIGTQDSGICCYDGTNFTSFSTDNGLASNHITAMLQDQNGLLWFALEDGGICCYDGTNFTSFSTDDGLASNHITIMLQDQDSGLWIGTQNSGICYYDGTNFTSFSTDDGLASNHITAMLQDQDGCLWLGGDRTGSITRYDGKDFISFGTADGLFSNGVRTMLTDREGFLWLGTIGGVNRYNGKTFTSFLPQTETKDTVYSMIQDQDGKFWFALRQGSLTSYDGQNFTSFSTLDGLISEQPRRIFQDRNGHLWIATQDSGLSRYDGQTFTTLTTQDGLASNSIETIFEDSSGFMWFGTDSGISRYDGQTFTTFTTANGLISNRVTVIFQDRDDYIWIGTRHLGVCRFDGHKFTIFTLKDGLAGDGVMSIFQDQDGYLWFGTNGGGVSRYDGQNFSTFTTANGLAGNVVWSIIQDREGHLWFGTNGGGVSRFDGQTFSTFTSIDGLAGNIVWSIIQDQEGYLWFGTNGGITRYTSPPPLPPSLAIKRVIADQYYDDVSKVTLSANVGSIVIEFQGMSFKTRPNALAYRYRLKGHDSDWHNTHQHSVEYRNLPMGDYIFEIVAIDRDLVHSVQPVTLDLKIVADPRLEALTSALSEWNKSKEFVGESEILRQFQMQITEIANTDMTVLILGETGTGKGLAAMALHSLSKHRTGPFIHVNCGAIPEGLVESELFGHERGAFTGANMRKLGKVELAKNGTLFLDEIGDLAQDAQVKILRLLEEHTFERVGGTETLEMTVRVVAATNQDLAQMVQEGRFRKDLYFRLQTFPVHLPPLRQRREDIPLLTTYFMDNISKHVKKEVLGLQPEALTALQAYDWPGNVRELENVIKRAVIVCPESTLRIEDLALGVGKKLAIASENFLTPGEYEKRYIQQVLEKAGGVIRRAAAIWGVPESTLRSRMKKLGIRIKKSGIVQHNA